MARITKERKFRTEAPEFHDILPERVVAVFDLLRCGESPVYHANLAYSGTVQPLKGSNPQVQIGVHRILHEHWDVRVGECLCNFLDKERIGCRPRPNPHEVNAIFQTVKHMLLICHLRGYLQPKFSFCPLHPLQSLRSDSLKAAGMRTRFPYPRTIDIYSYFLQLSCRRHHLFFRFRAARARNNARTRRKMEHSPFVQRGYFEFRRFCHIILKFFLFCSPRLSVPVFFSRPRKIWRRGIHSSFRYMCP